MLKEVQGARTHIKRFKDRGKAGQPCTTRQETNSYEVLCRIIVCLLSGTDGGLCVASVCAIKEKNVSFPFRSSTYVSSARRIVYREIICHSKYLKAQKLVSSSIFINKMWSFNICFLLKIFPYKINVWQIIFREGLVRVTKYLLRYRCNFITLLIRCGIALGYNVWFL